MTTWDTKKYSVFEKTDLQNSNLKKTTLSKTSNNEPTPWREHESWACWETVLVATMMEAHLQISGDSSEPSGQSFSPSQRQPLEIQVTWSLHTNCLELQVLGWSSALGAGKEKRRRSRGELMCHHEKQLWLEMLLNHKYILKEMQLLSNQSKKYHQESNFFFFFFKSVFCYPLF